MKNCTRCHEQRPIPDFRKRGKYLSSWCRDCERKYLKKWKIDHSESQKAKFALYYLSNADEFRARAKKYYADHAGDLKPSARERSKIWRAANLSRALESSRKWHIDNSDHVKKYRAENRENILAFNRNYRALRRSAPGSHDASDIEGLWSIQGGRCGNLACRKKLSSGYHVDHIMPLSLGGANGVDNLQLLCQKCNLQKHNTHPEKWCISNGLLPLLPPDMTAAISAA